VRRTGF